MKKRKLILALGCAVLLAGSAVVFAGLGGNDDQASDLDLNNDFPDLGGCVCPMVYDPVVCFKEGPDGTIVRKSFSNACFAGCEGFTRCASFSFNIR
ncbi:MAG: hypothetical protein GTN89_04585 [Acidobacteria bacterium]|nr:hypothetical protein [Acidobacteriota bacterium]NIM60422.1 hypothetical protein [Acidobacteriota bacterium]NIO58597.1 hypothetical protein [Acidobacteriota bacterium]NIQ29649.1 hypothetical protein [Acidobacteriota bacterium]NIQ84366.1 hypothetical protein [Acidobacteriota bacterium]